MAISPPIASAWTGAFEPPEVGPKSGASIPRASSDHPDKLNGFGYHPPRQVEASGIVEVHLIDDVR
jgi:hypothetical protein